VQGAANCGVEVSPAVVVPQPPLGIRQHKVQLRRRAGDLQAGV
jgi:hypothetical protein